MSPFEMAQRIEFWPIGRLVPYDRNARTHTPAQVTKIANSIREFGFNNPILVDSGSGVIAGHARLEAAKQLGLTEVPVIELTHLTDVQRRAYILADNRLALEAGWDTDALMLEIGELRVADFDIALTGFDERELRQFLSAPAGAPEPTEPENDRGVIRLSCKAEDATAIVDYLKDALRKRGFRNVEIARV